jgi:hypothetical protein
MTTLAWSGVVAGALVLGVIAGRALAPTRTVETVRTVEVEKQVRVVVTEAATASTATAAVETRWRTRTVYQPGGTVVVTREAQQLDAHATTTASTAASRELAATEHARALESTRVTETARPGWSAGAQVGLGLDGLPRYGAQGARRLLGGLWVTLAVDVTGRAGLVGARLDW